METQKINVDVESEDDDDLSDKKPRTEEEIIEEINEKFEIAKEFWAPIHAAYLEDLKFASGEQWDEKTKSARKIEGLSSLVYNKFPALYKYIVNNVRANLPGIKCSPTSEGANKNTAKVLDGLLKFIQYQSNAKQAYINALLGCVIGGIGCWKVSPVEVGGDPSLSIDRITDPTTVFFDPSGSKQDYTDAEYVFEEIWLDEKQIKARDPKLSLEDLETGTGTKKDKVKVLCYWVKNSETGLVERYLISGSKIIEHLDAYKGSYLPVVIITGEEINIEEQRIYKGIVRDNKDIQRYINLAKSKEADWMGRSANAQWLVEEKHISKYTSLWNSANVNGIPVLVYSAGANGSLPTKQEPPNPPVGFMQVAQAASDDLRTAVAVRDPLRDIPQTQSGKAISLQMSQSDIGTYEYIDHLKDGLKHTGCIAVDLIPHVFGYAHIREIMGQDGQVTTVPIGQPYQENDQVVFHDLTKGKYTVTLSEGPDYESQRSEASDKLMEVSQKYPEFMKLAGDIIFRNMSFDGADEIADRLRSQIPPEVLAASSSSNGDSASRLGLVQNQNNMLNQQLQQLQQALQDQQNQNQQLQQVINTKQSEIQIGHQADMELETLKFNNSYKLKQLDIQGKITGIGAQGTEKIKEVEAQTNAADYLDHEEARRDLFEDSLTHNISNI